jgi:hypothetical protein
LVYGKSWGNDDGVLGWGDGKRFFGIELCSGNQFYGALIDGVFRMRYWGEGYWIEKMIPGD